MLFLRIKTTISGNLDECLEDIKINRLMLIEDKLNSYRLKAIKDFDCWLIDVHCFVHDMDFIKENLHINTRETHNNNRSCENLLFLRYVLTRIILCCNLCIDFNTLEFEYNIYNKPFIKNKEYKTTFFNVSHSKNLLLVGVKQKKQIGVDVQFIKNSSYAIHGIESILSHDEWAKYQCIEDRVSKLQYLYTVWVQKEALSKALGCGLVLNFTQITVKYFAGVQSSAYLLFVASVAKTFSMYISTNDKFCLSAAYQV